MHHFVTEMCTCVHISVTKYCIVGYGTYALWDLGDGLLAYQACQLQRNGEVSDTWVTENKIIIKTFITKFMSQNQRVNIKKSGHIDNNVNDHISRYLCYVKLCHPYQMPYLPNEYITACFSVFVCTNYIHTCSPSWQLRCSQEANQK